MTVTITGKLSNEASQDTEGTPVYVFLDDSKSGYDAWITPEVGDILIIEDVDESFTYEITMPLKERNFGKFKPPIRSYWFDKGYRAHLIRKSVQPEIVRDLSINEEVVRDLLTNELVLLRLQKIIDEYKQERKILYSKLLKG